MICNGRPDVVERRRLIISINRYGTSASCTRNYLALKPGEADAERLQESVVLGRRVAESHSSRPA